MKTIFDFSGRSILVTGASSGIGRVTVEMLCASGAQVVAAARNVGELARLAEETGCEPLVLDVGDEAAIDTTASSFDSVMNVNARGAILVARHVARAMIDAKRAGSIVNVSSQAALVGLEDHLSYCASKAAMDAITRVLCVELGAYGIRVNSINPTVTLTPMAVKAWSEPSKRDPALQAIPLKRFAEPREVAEPILFLLSDAASMITGVTLPIDGGYTAR